MKSTLPFRIALCTTMLFCTFGCVTPDVPVLPDGGLPDPLSAGWQGKPVCEQLALTPRQRVLKCTFPPGVGHERHYHAPHFGYALSGGRMRLIDVRGVREVDLAADSHFTSEGTDWHEVLNIGSTTVQYLIVEPRAGVGTSK